MSIYRSFTDDNRDFFISTAKHSRIYSFANTAYNISQIIALGAGTFVGLSKLVQ